MKYLFLYCCIFILSLHSYGQKIRFSDTTNKWRVANYGIDGGTIEIDSFAGTRIIDSVQYNVFLTESSEFDTVFIREDTINHKVFIRLLHNWFFIPQDTDLLLYDYNLNIGDTIKHYSILDSEFVHVVVNVDSVMINDSIYRVWYFRCIKGGYREYAVVEGIGSLSTPWFPIYPYEFENKFTMTCFQNNKTHPLPIPAVQYEHGNPYFLFDNITSCMVNVYKISQTSNQAELLPNPANEKSKITFPYIQVGCLVIYNEMGQVVYNAVIENKNEQLIGDKIQLSGLYFYRIQDNKNAKVFSGKFIYQ